MKVVAINGSPRPKGNTFQLIELVFDAIIEEDDKGRLWVGTTNSLCIYDRKHNLILKSEDYKINLKNNSVNDIVKWGNNMIIGFGGGGIVYIDSSLNIVRQYISDIDRPNTLSSNAIRDLFFDKDQRLWVGTYGGAINVYDPHTLKFEHIKHEPKNPNSLSQNIARGVGEGPNGNIWFGTEKGLSIYIRKDETWKHLFGEENTNFTITCFCNDGNKVWVGTYGNGAYLIDANTFELTNFRNNKKDTNSLGSDRIFSIIKDFKGNIWFGGLRGEITVYNPATKNFKRYSAINVTDIEEIDSIIYIGSYSFIRIYNPNTGAWKEYDTEILNTNVRDFFQDSKKRIWIASDKGVFEFNPAEESFKRYTEHDGLQSSVIHGIVEDQRGKLWLGTVEGISSLQPETGVFTNFDKADGLPFQEINRRTIASLSTGELIFGGNKGFIIMNPENFKKYYTPINITFKNLMISNKPADFGDEGSPLKKVINRTEKIILNHNQNSFSVSFNAINYTSSEKNHYIWKLDGFDKDWTPPGKSNTAVYTNLEPGNYILRVKAFIGKYGQSLKERSIKITIVPPFWKTTIFKIVFVITLCLIVYLIFYLRVKILRKQKALLEKKVIERTSEIKEKNKMLYEQADSLSETNAQLEERQQEVEEQAEELRNQAEHLFNVNEKLEQQSLKLIEQTNYLNKVNLKLEEQSQLLKKQTDELADTNSKLKEINSSKDKLFSIIAHDLKNPFSAIIGYSEILVSQFDSLSKEMRVTYAKRIYDSSNNVFRLLQNLLNWSRTQINSLTVNRESLDLTQIIKDSIHILKANINKKGLLVTFNHCNNIIVHADSNMIKTVIQNLLTNAIKFTPIGGKIFVNCSIVEEHVQVSVKDTGIGMSKEIIQTLFKIEKSKSRPGTNGEAGSGLGLLLCKEFVNKNGGEIWVESKPDSGSVFYFTLELSSISKQINN